MLFVDNVSLTLGDFHLNSLSLHLESPEYWVIIGPSGAGKTILLETIAGIHRPDKGRIYFEGNDITHYQPKDRHIAMMYQDLMLFPHMTVRENILFSMKIRKTDDDDIKEKVSDLVNILGISNLIDRNPDTLSGGEAQRVALTRALIQKPRLLLLDEPLSALDSMTRERLRQEIRKIHQHLKIPIIHITHHFEDVYALAEKVAIMQDGMIVQTGKPEDVFSHPCTPYVAQICGTENIFRGEATADGTGSVLNLGALCIRITAPYSGPVVVALRSEDIIISLERFRSSARHTLQATVVELIPSGPFIRVVLNTGIRMIAMVTRTSCEEFALKPGCQVFVTFKESAIHVIPTGELDDERRQ
ncbi:MAG: ATP-binding cassette domain-containing protein [Methanospirillum sp.]|uniref:ABC transporter ATP-binding protein n=1 Tax=Methanospirillum sp. TaxID=45200 RepID=UPI00236F9E63|nr:ATP-binding cassette domain-containing protein [Methanospirillum sp.]MDD1729020.1 ATP-binding cassette domain-containing protein [Methanospirillum sp.]